MTNKHRITVSLDPELSSEIEEYRHNNRITSQSKAIQELTRIGLQSLYDKRKTASTQGEEMNSQEQELLRIAKGLDADQKAVLLHLLDVVCGSGDVEL